MAADVLFQQHSIKEIQEIEKKLRNDIERKKEELRQMVGERYRDLMEAADTITEMKEISEKVKLRVHTVENFCDQLKQNCLQSDLTSSIKNKVLERQKKNENLYIIASLIKVLKDAPPKIWNLIESEDFLNALLLYLLARHVHSILVLDPVYRKQEVLVSFPIINKQWISTRHFQHILLQKSKEMLIGESHIDSKKVMGPLCCIAFLSDTSVNQVFHVFLSSRKVAVSKIFKPEKSAKSQLCEVINVILNTLKIVHDLFYVDPSSAEDSQINLLQITINSVSSKDHPGPVSLLDKSSPTFQYLPKDVLAFRPILNARRDSISQERIRGLCEEWIESVSCDIRNCVCDLLEFVTSVKSLALIREAVMLQISQISEWPVISQHLFDRSFSLWDYLLRRSVIERIKALINYHVESSSKSCSKDVGNAFRNLQGPDIGNCSVSSYIWTESETDIAPSLCWTPHHQRQLLDSGTLKLKACALTPEIQSICAHINSKLEDMLQDIAHFLNKEKNQSDWLLTEYQMQSAESIDALLESEEDFAAIQLHLIAVTENSFLGLASYFEELLSLLENTKDEKQNVASEVVFLGYLCHGLIMLCPNLSKCLLRENPNVSSKQILSGIGSNVKHDDELWQKLKLRLLDISNSAFRLWGEIKTSNLVGKIDRDLIVCSGSGILKSLLQWDKIEIQEESEEGNPVTSVLRIPQQISVPLYNFLFSFSWELNNIGGHALTNQVRSEFREKLLLELLQVYQRKVDIEWTPDLFSLHLSQTQSLQLLFDVQFLMGLMAPREQVSNAISNLSNNILSKLVAHIDPFDMDVFSSHIQVNLRRALQRSVLLFGLIANPEQTSYLNSLKTVTGQMEHNLMLVPPMSSRLPLLPFAARSSSEESNIPESYFHASIQNSPVKQPRSHNSSPNLTAENTSNVLKSSSFYDRVTAMSNSWFGGI